MPLFAKIVIELNVPIGVSDSEVDEMIPAYECLDLRDYIKDLVIGRLMQRAELDPVTVHISEE
jgi:hypothetical protein